MGANASSIDSGQDGLHNPSLKPKLEDIPEACVALVLSYLDPPEICKLARINRAFHAASSADFIWESKLPSNYRYILEELLGLSVAGMCKKDIFAKLSRSNSFDGGTKEIWIDKNDGRVCLAICSKEMTITGIDDRRYWNHISTDESSGLGSKLSHIFNKCGGLKLMGTLSSIFPQEHIVYSLDFSLAGSRRGWDVESVTRITFMDGT